MYYCDLIGRQGFIRGKRMVFLQPERPEVPKRISAEPGCRVGLLEGDGYRQDNLVGREERRNKEGAGFLRWKSSERDQNELDYARVSPHSLLPEERKFQGIGI